jgi:hypothetical protein
MVAALIVILRLVKTTAYFEWPITRRPDVDRRWVERVFHEPARSFQQPDGRTRLWGYIDDARKWLRVVVEPDGRTVHNALFDRNYRP